VLPFLAGASIGPSQAKRELSLVPRFFEPDFLAPIGAVKLRAVLAPIARRAFSCSIHPSG